MAFYGALWLSGSADVLATQLHVSFEVVIRVAAGGRAPRPARSRPRSRWTVCRTLRAAEAGTSSCTGTRRVSCPAARRGYVEQHGRRPARWTSRRPRRDRPYGGPRTSGALASAACPTRLLVDTLADAAHVFGHVRPRLFGIAYRMLGSWTEAEDVVQDVWLRWQGTDRTVVQNPAAFLATTTTRLASTSRSPRARVGRRTSAPGCPNRSTPAPTRPRR